MLQFQHIYRYMRKLATVCFLQTENGIRTFVFLCWQRITIIDVCCFSKCAHLWE